MDSTNTPNTQGGAQDVVPASLNAGLERAVGISPPGWIIVHAPTGQPVKINGKMFRFPSERAANAMLGCFFTDGASEEADAADWLDIDFNKRSTLRRPSSFVIVQEAHGFTLVASEITSPTGWRRMETAPARDPRAVIDIWSGSEECRYTDCFWLDGYSGWYIELATEEGDYNTIRVPEPVAWMPVPKKPEWA